VYRRRLGVALDMEPASIGSRPHMMHRDQDSSATAAPVQKNDTVRIVDGNFAKAMLVAAAACLVLGVARHDELSRAVIACISAIIMSGGVEKAVARRPRVHDAASADKLLVSGYHFPFPGLGYIERADSGYRLIRAAWNPVI
jgi:hypothetical protein